ncbi:MAG: CDP-alcohol phosphatidyltransferase family protein [Candidatus Riflebacteria bacterium]|nr:CDP-alcohol phosphatidyltransferase family protein [Candidatus Riflebacteria bacterium]
MAAIGHTIGLSRYVVPQLFTFASIGCAVMSMRSTNLPAEPAWWILYSVLLDKLDGTAARLLKAQSRIGVQLDSLADLIAFGIAPAHLFYRIMSQSAIDFTGDNVVWGALAIIYALATAWRLHRFNQEAGGAQSKSFRGMPSTLSGALFATYVVAHMPGADLTEHFVLVAIMPVLSVAMNLNYRSRKVTIPVRKPLLLLQAVFAVFLYYATFCQLYPKALFGCAGAGQRPSVR